MYTVAFSSALPLPHVNRHSLVVSYKPVFMRLRNNSRIYNPSFDRSNRKSNLQSVPSAHHSQLAQHPSSDTHQSQYSPQLASQDPPSPPPSPPGGNGNSNWHNEEEEEEENSKPPPVNAEISAILAAANRTLASLPAEASLATPSQLSRLISIQANPILSFLSRLWPALRYRLIANERLPIQMGVELTVGFITKTLAEVQGRKERFWKEFDFYISDLALELVGDAMLVWLLCPVATFGVQKPGFLSTLPTHFAQIGLYSTAQRATTFIYKGLQFGMVGFLSSVVGHGLTVALVNQRNEQKRKNGEQVEGVQLAGVLPTSLVWGAFMMTSSNIRYQLVNAVEQRVLEKWLGTRVALLTGGSFVLRFSNCFLGGMQWLPIAKFAGIQ